MFVLRSIIQHIDYADRRNYIDSVRLFWLMHNFQYCYGDTWWYQHIEFFIVSIGYAWRFCVFIATLVSSKIMKTSTVNIVSWSARSVCSIIGYETIFFIYIVSVVFFIVEEFIFSASNACIGVVVHGPSEYSYALQVVLFVWLCMLSVQQCNRAHFILFYMFVANFDCTYACFVSFFLSSFNSALQFASKGVLIKVA